MPAPENGDSHERDSLTAMSERDASRPRFPAHPLAGSRRDKLQAPASASDPRGAEASWLLRDSRRELHGRRRPASSRARSPFAATIAVSLHGVCMSIGAPQPLDTAHLARFRDLVRRYEPALVSEHLAWSTHENVYFNDLLPLPLHRGDARDGVRSHRRGPGGHRPAAASGKSFDLCPLPRIDDERDGFHPRGRPAHRLRPAARRQQCLRVGDQPRLFAARLSVRFSARSRRRDPSRRTYANRATTRASRC